MLLFLPRHEGFANLEIGFADAYYFKIDLRVLEKKSKIRNMLQCVKDECYYEGRDEWSEKDLCYRDPTHLKKETNEQ